MSDQTQVGDQAPSLAAIRHLKIMTLFEGGSLILLVLIAVPLKYMADMPQFVSVIGPIHGVFFLWMVAVLAFVLLRRQLKLVDGLITFIAAFIPFGGFFSHYRVNRAIVELEAKYFGNAAGDATKTGS
ncbi:MAG TPA: DUF3817 domain-containing protein [Halothiobacillaceae bacterium]|nr:DUF3817 domain-containing protein [Halothiobacillaceae bacterium]